MKKLTASILKCTVLGVAQGLFASAVMAAGVTITCPPVNTITNDGTFLSATTTVNSKKILWEKDLNGQDFGDILQYKIVGIHHGSEGPMCAYRGPEGSILMLYSEPIFKDSYDGFTYYHCSYPPVICDDKQPSCNLKLTIPDTKACMQFWAK